MTAHVLAEVSKRLISTDAALHKIHVQYYMKVRMLQCEYFIKCKLCIYFVGEQQLEQITTLPSHW